jgi:hypothetical protein
MYLFVAREEDSKQFGGTAGHDSWSPFDELRRMEDPIWLKMENSFAALAVAPLPWRRRSSGSAAETFRCFLDNASLESFRYLQGILDTFHFFSRVSQKGRSCHLFKAAFPVVTTG